MDRSNWKIQIGPDPVAGLIATYVDGVKRDAIDGGPLVQEESLAFGTERKFFDRGNFSAARPFTITKEFPDNQQSRAWYETAAQTFNGVKDVKLTFRDYSGAETTYLITAANVKVTADEPIGVTVIAKLTITGGKAILQP